MSRRFAISDTSIAGVRVIERTRLEDSRGFFERLFCSNELAVGGWKGAAVQINRTLTMRRGTVRGLHFQYPPHAEMKLVYCLKGEVFDVVLDLRTGSPTLLQFHAEVLSEENRKALFIPEGIAHGFQTMTDDVEMLYLHSAAYAEEAEGGVYARDPLLAISWPLEVSEVSARDAALPKLDPSFTGLQL